MNHYPYLTLKDETEITFSDIKNEKVTLYCETPDEKLGFKNARIDYPFTTEGFYDVYGYTKEELAKLLYHITKIGHIAYDIACERAEERKDEVRECQL